MHGALGKGLLNSLKRRVQAAHVYDSACPSYLFRVRRENFLFVVIRHKLVGISRDTSGPGFSVHCL